MIIWFHFQISKILKLQGNLSNLFLKLIHKKVNLPHNYSNQEITHYLHTILLQFVRINSQIFHSNFNFMKCDKF